VLLNGVYAVFCIRVAVSEFSRINFRMAAAQLSIEEGAACIARGRVEGLTRYLGLRCSQVPVAMASIDQNRLYGMKVGGRTRTSQRFALGASEDCESAT
jgi:hypothetical protein